VKGFPSFNPLAFTHAPLDVTISMLCEDLILETLFGIEFSKFMVYFGEELVTFGYVVGVFLPRKFQLILRIFELVSQEDKTRSLSDQSLYGRALEV
jgi:hypothetical protein